MKSARVIWWRSSTDPTSCPLSFSREKHWRAITRFRADAEAHVVTHWGYDDGSGSKYILMYSDHLYIGGAQTWSHHQLMMQASLSIRPMAFSSLSVLLSSH